MVDYCIVEHRHRFAAWAAARAASTSRLCRFQVEQGKLILEDANLNRLACDAGNLPNSEEFDEQHRRWRSAVIRFARRRGIKAFTHGVAAKLINVYLKSIFVCGGLDDHPRVRAIHPPIDSVLLDKLYQCDVAGLRTQWKAAREARWSKMRSRQYERLIRAIQKAMPPPRALWEIEKYWQGYR